MLKLPVAVLAEPAWVTVTGTSTSWLTPLITSAPRTSNLPAPSALTALLWKLA